ncbi:TMV resistance protein N isoform X1 [Arachis hypogaea]|uniref:TMV resistance protein N isoform X1 n=1 Tax=Arachis hypogaea TaxID=3818 RepID=UPI0010FC5CD6|nr:TMV resistance protein N isoform X1 [Arachis hypogaea]QHO48214.1 TMV resistance protein N [Arachis hypogaea]QHO48215.1 TMV resistance protein N [Arachis hypogaea]QHO48216.1 TMV resistance protein N [Arachis hypogaea]
MANADAGESSETNKSNYDIFLSFRGEDTRHTFTGYLYEALSRKGIKTFMDNENLRIGDSIGPNLLKTIEHSRISIVVFSENYAASKWCLDELVKILECRNEKNMLLFPIFYKVAPSDVRYQRNSYEKAMAAHELRYGCGSEKVKKWRSALFDVSQISGHVLREGYEYKFIQDIVCKADAKLLSSKQLHIDEDMVGLQFKVEEVKSLLDLKSSDSTSMVGIYGIGGIGKTTLAKALYNTICNQFEGACFLFDVRKTSNQEKGQVHLQQTFLLELLEEGKIKFSSVEKGISILKDRLAGKKVLVVLDDVDNMEQLRALAGKCGWFGSGSRIIITTRNKYLLTAHQVKSIYEMKLLNVYESLELFCLNAFKMSSPATNYDDLSNRAIGYAKGLPLALKVIGSNLIGKDLNEWKSALKKYKRNPHRDIQSILRISYDSLESNEKDIFLDIACFFNGQRLEYVKRILDGCEFYTEDGLRILIDRSLITVEDGHLRMHDLIQDMGRDVVKQEAPKDAAERSRLWLREDVLQVLTENRGSSKIEGIKLDCLEENLISRAFEEMKKLRILIVRNTSFSFGRIHLPNQLRLLDWKGFPSKSFPPDFYPKKIAAFNLRCSPLVLKKPFQKFEHLTYMNFSYCQSITRIPDVSGAKNLTELILNKCKKLVKVDESVGFLPNLVYLSASGCIQLRSFLPRIFLPSLEFLSFDMCRRLAFFPDIVGTMDKPLKICMKDTAIRELPPSFANLSGLGYLDMSSCKQLQKLPSELFVLPNFVTLKIGGCPQLRESFTQFKGCDSRAECWPNLETLHFCNACLSDEDLYMIVHSFPKLIELNVSSNYFVSIPAYIKESINLTTLDVSYCLKLQQIPALPSSIQKVDARHCNSLTADSSSTLWSQMPREIDRLEVAMPETEIPEWLDYHGHGESPIFWARGKFPVVALAFVVDEINYQVVNLHLFIDNEHVTVQSQHLIFNIAEDHVLLFDLRVLFRVEEWKRLDARFQHDNCWKSIQVKCEPDIILKDWGVHVYKKETNMDDIQFSCPYPATLGSGSCMGLNLIWVPRDWVEEGSATGTDSSSDVEELDTILQVKEASCSSPCAVSCSCYCSAGSSSFKKLLGFKFRRRLSINMISRWPEDDVDDIDFRNQEPLSFSENLQTVMENLRRLAAPRQKKGMSNGDHDNDSLKWLAETEILSDGEYEDEEEESDSEA